MCLTMWKRALEIFKFWSAQFSIHPLYSSVRTYSLFSLMPTCTRERSHTNKHVSFIYQHSDSFDLQSVKNERFRIGTHDFYLFNVHYIVQSIKLCFMYSKLIFTSPNQFLIKILIPILSFIMNYWLLNFMTVKNIKTYIHRNRFIDLQTINFRR